MAFISKSDIYICMRMAGFMDGVCIEWMQINGLTQIVNIDTKISHCVYK